MPRGRPPGSARRGRPPKTPLAAKKPKYLYAGAGSASRDLEFDESSSSSRGIRSQRSARKPIPRKPWDSDDDDDGEARIVERHVSYYDDSDASNKSVNDQSDDVDDQSEDDDAMEQEDENSNTNKPYPWKIRIKIPPKYLELEELPLLTLPQTSSDLLIKPEHLMTAIGTYEILRHFRTILRMTPFRFEDFCASLMVDEQNQLFSEIHIVLMKALIREDDIQGTQYVPQDLKDALHVNFLVMDHFSWPDALKLYLSADPNANSKILDECIDGKEYPFVNVELKLKVLHHLCDQFLQVTSVREEVMTEGQFRHDDHCRVCHKLGDLLCCESCPAVYHLTCVDPPLREVPAEEFMCTVCKANQVVGVTDIISEIEKSGYLCRQDSLGWDRNGRRYWFLARRIIVEPEDDSNDVKYYSTVAQLDELIAALDEEDYENDLVRNIQDVREDIIKHMEITEKLTNASKNGRKSFFDVDNERIEQLQKQRLAKEQEQIKKEKEEASENNDTLVSNMKSDNESDKVKSEDKKEEISANASTSSPSESDEKKGIVTRLKTGSIQLKPIILDPLKKALLANKDDELLVPSKDGEGLTRILRKNATAAQNQLLFKLGLEANYKNYTNQYNTNQIALNKHQLAEERDRKRYISHKFSLTPASEFKWQSASSGSRTVLVSTLRQTIIAFEGLLLAPFLHPNWGLHRQNWLKAVNMCTNAKDFALALCILESSMKPVLFTTAWHEAVGYTHLKRTTTLEREEMKKQEKRDRRERLEEEDAGMYKFNVHVHYVFGKLKHQIWKQKGEEYRLSGIGGWFWQSRTKLKNSGRYSKPKPVEIIELSEEQQEKVATEPLINISAEMKKKKNDRIFYPSIYTGTWNSSDSHFTPKYKNNMRILESLLERRILQHFIQDKEEKKKQETTTEEKKKEHENPCVKKCYSTLCKSNSSVQLACYSYGCREQVKINKTKSDEEEKLRLDQEKADDASACTEISNCKSRVYLHKIVKVNNVLQLAKRTGKRLLGKGQLPPCHRFTTNKGQQKSILVLPKFDLKRLSRCGSLREVPGFSYTCKLNALIWPFHTTPRPVFRTCWLFRNQQISSVHAVSNQLKILWASVRWDDLQQKAPTSGTNTITSETEVITTELLKRREIAPFGIRSEYLVRRIIVPIEVPTYKPKEKATPIRSGLRERKRQEEPQHRGPTVSEIWLPEEHLELWELKQFGEKLEKAQIAAKERQAQLAAKQEADKLKAKMEENLKKQREELAKKREEDRLKNAGRNSTVTTPVMKASAAVNRASSLIQNKGNVKRIFTSKQNTPVASPVAQATGAYAMIRTTGGQTFKVPLSALQGKTAGQMIVIKTTSSNGGPVTTTTATIVSTFTPPAVAATQTTAQTSTISTNTIVKATPTITAVAQSPGTVVIRAPGQTPVRPLTQYTPTQNKIQVVRPGITINRGPIGQSVVTAQTPVAATQQQTAQLPIKMPNGSIQYVQIPISMLNGNQQLQIAIQSPQTQTIATSTVTSQPQTIQIVSTPPTIGVSNTQQIRLINTSSVLTTPSTPAMNRIIIRANTPAVTTMVSSISTPQTPTVIQTPNSSQMLAQQIAQQIKAGTIQLRLNQNQVSTSQTTPTGTRFIIQKPGATQLQLKQPITVQSAQLKVPNQVAPKQLVIQTPPQVQNPALRVPQQVSVPVSIITTPIKSSPTVVGLTSATPVATVSSPEAGSTVGAGQFVLTSQMTQDIVKQALMNPNVAPEIQQKLLALQKHHLQQGPVTGTPSTTPTVAASQLTVTPSPIKTPSRLNSSRSRVPTSRKRPLSATAQAAQEREKLLVQQQSMTPVELEESNRTMACRQVVKSMLDRIDREEKNEVKKKKAKEAQMQQKWRANNNKLQLQLSRHADIIKRDMAKRRALLEKDIRDEIQHELNTVINTKKPKEKENKQETKAVTPIKADTKQLASTIVPVKGKSTVKTKLAPTAPAAKKAIVVAMPVKANSPVKRKLSESVPINTPTISKSEIVTSVPIKKEPPSHVATPPPSKQRKISNSLPRSKPGANMSRKQSRSPAKRSSLTPKSSSVNEEVNQNASDHGTELYCLCRKPYEEGRFMVACDGCDNWYHVECIGLTEQTANELETYICDKCKKKNDKSAVNGEISVPPAKTVAASAEEKPKGLPSDDTPKRLYCICQAPYDKDSLMVGCDGCDNWFHVDCIGLNEQSVTELESYMCEKCEKEESSSEMNGSIC